MPAVPSFTRSIGFVLAQLGRATTRQWLETLSDLDLTPHAHAVLLTLQEFGPLPLTQLAAIIQVDPRNMNPVLDGMAPLIDRGVDSTDRRRRTVILSAQGRAAAARVAQATAQAEAALVHPLTTAEREELRRLLLQLAATLPSGGDPKS